MDDWKLQRRDALVSASCMFILSAAVMITATATLHEAGMKMNHIKEMIPMLQPLFGPAALFVFTLGILAAGLSSHLPNMMVAGQSLLKKRTDRNQCKVVNSSEALC